ncbi:MAG: hypothetical protein ACI8UG_000580 [Gammaproteobacteria bacterium]|jgi:hypothetical protein
MNIVKSHSKKVLLSLVFGGLFASNVMANHNPNSPKPVNLGSAGTFSILTKTGITDVYPSVVTGDVGTSPITGAALLLKCTEVSGNIYTVDAAGPLPCASSSPNKLTSAISDMELAYEDAASRVSPNETELGAGEIGGLTLPPGLYKWTSNLSISTTLTLDGGPDDVWIFQVSGNLLQASTVEMKLQGGALAKNVFWQVAGGVTLGTGGHFEGIVLSKTLIAIQTGTSVTGRLFAQTAVTLQMNTVTAPVNGGQYSVTLHSK